MYKEGKRYFVAIVRNGYTGVDIGWCIQVLGEGGKGGRRMGGRGGGGERDKGWVGMGRGRGGRGGGGVIF